MARLTDAALGCHHIDPGAVVPPRPTRLRVRTALTALTGLLGAFAVTVAVAPHALAEEVYDRPAGGVFSIEGHGWGHGHGLSQWGAQGAASLGRTGEEITAAYYPGTARGVLAAAPIRVLLQGDDDGDTTVIAAAGLTVSDLASGAAATLPTGPTRWRATAASDGLHLASLTGSTWTPYGFGRKMIFAGPLRFAGPTTVQLTYPDGSSRDYRGSVQAVRSGASGLVSVAVLDLEDYLLGVVPRESSSSWKPAALQAQAIAARSYSAYKRAHSAGAWDICDTTQCQVFGGSALHTAGGDTIALEPASTTDAVHATTGVVRTYGGAPVFAEFSSSNGGWSTDGGSPYLLAARDDWDGAVANTVHSWTATLAVSDLERRYPAVGHLQRLRVTRRDGNGEWGGRVKDVVLEGVSASGAATSVTTTGVGIYNAHTWPASGDGLRSSWWHVHASTASGVVSQSAAPRLVLAPGLPTGRLTVSLKNTGNTSWPVPGLHLAVASPPGEADPLVGSSTRPGAFVRNAGRPGANDIAPGEVANFAFSLDATGVPPGLQGRAYRLRSGTGPLFGSTVSWQIPVVVAVLAAAPAARPTGRPASGDAPPPVWADGHTVVVPVRGSTTVRLTARNTGNVTWPAGAVTPVRLGTSGPRERTSPSYGVDWLSPTRPARLGAATAPGATGGFELVLHGAGRPAGVSTEAFEPTWDGRRYLGGATTLTVVRVDPAVPHLAAVATAPPAALRLTNSPTGTATVVLRLRNLGGVAWPVGQESLTSGAASSFSTAAWRTTSRPPALAGNASRPGARAVWPGEVGEWRVPVSAFHQAVGTRSLVLSPVGGGPSVATSITVTPAVLAGVLVAVHPSVTVPSTGVATSWFDVRNTGNVAWPVGGAVRSAVLTAGGSPSRAVNWIGPARPGSAANLSSPGSRSVAPGQLARFVVTLAGNRRTPRAVSEPFGVVWEGWGRLGLRAVLSYAMG